MKSNTNFLEVNEDDLQKLQQRNQRPLNFDFQLLRRRQFLKTMNCQYETPYVYKASEGTTQINIREVPFLKDDRRACNFQFGGCMEMKSSGIT